MSETGTDAAKRPVGRPSEYRHTHPETAKRLCELGLTDAEIAQFFDIAPGTFYRWKHEFPQFREAVTRGKELADDVVEASLFKSAVGHTHEAVKIFMPAGAEKPVF